MGKTHKEKERESKAVFYILGPQQVEASCGNGSHGTSNKKLSSRQCVVRQRKSDYGDLIKQ